VLSSLKGGEAGWSLQAGMPFHCFCPTCPGRCSTSRMEQQSLSAAHGVQPRSWMQPNRDLCETQVRRTCDLHETQVRRICDASETHMGRRCDASGTQMRLTCDAGATYMRLSRPKHVKTRNFRNFVGFFSLFGGRWLATHPQQKSPRIVPKASLVFISARPSRRRCDAPARGTSP